MSVHPDAACGRTDIERFRVLRPLGSGGSARVFLAEDRLQPGDPVALKLLRDPGPASLRVARREFGQLARLSHPHVVAVHDFGRLEDGSLFISTEFIEGADLARWSRGRGEDELGSVLVQICRALQYLHDRGVVHGDLKPANVLVRDDGQAKLVDFGLASGGAQRPNQTEGISGTPRYMAPELLEGRSSPAPATDLYSLGVLLGELDGLGRAGIRTLQGWLTSPRPEHRPQGADAVIAALGHELERDVALTAAERAGAYFPTVPFVGREALIQRLEEHPPGVVLLRGPQGVGRTSVLAELRIRALLEDRPCVWGAPSGAAGAMQAPLRRLLGRAAETEGAAVVRLVDALICTLSRSGGRPLLLLDEASADDELCMQLLERLAGASELDVVCCAAVSDRVWSARHQQLMELGARELRMDGLAAEELSRLLRGMLPGLEISDEQVAAVHAATEGRPRVAEELVRVAIEAGRAERWLDPDALRLPDLGTLAADRIGKLDTGVRQALTELSLFVHGAPPELGPPRELRRVLLRRGLMVETGEGLQRVANPWLRQALLARLSPSQRTAGHRKAAVALEAGRSRLVTLALERSEQQLAAGEPGPAALGLTAVGRQLASEHDLAAASEALRRAAAAVHGTGSVVELEALSELGRVLRLAGRFDEAQSVHRQALELAGHAGSPAGLQVRQELAETLVATGALDEADALLEHLCDQCSGDALARVWLLRARLAVQRGDYAAAGEQAQEGLRVASSARPVQNADLQHLVGLSQLMEGDLDGALERFERALPIYEREGRFHAAARLLNSRAMLQQRRGELDAAARGYDRALELFERARDPRSQALALLNLGTVAQQRALLGEALVRYQQGRALSAEMGLGLDAARFSLNLGNLMLQMGELEAAVELLQRAGAAARHHEARELVAHTELFLAEAALLGRELEAARVHAKGGLEAFEALGQAAAAAEARLLRAQIELERGAWDEARGALSRVDLALPTDLAARRLLISGLLELRRPGGDHAAGRLRLQEALLQEDPGPSLLSTRWQVHRALAGEGADPEERRYHRERAAATLARLRELVPEPHRAAFDGCYGRGEPLEPLAGPGESALLELLQINRELTSERRPERVLELIIDRAIELTGAERGFVILAAGDRLEVSVARNLDQESLRRGALKFSRSVAERVVAAGEAVITDDAAEDERFRDNLSVHEMNLRSILCVPLRMQKQILGALYLDNRFRRDSFGPGHVQLLTAFADQAAIALHTATQLREAEQRAAELAATKATVETLNTRLQATVSAQADELEQMTARLGSEQQELIQRYSRSSSLVGRSKAMCEIFRLIDRVAQTAVPVLIQGETGTGKELIAKAIHYNSARRGGPFVSVNCAAIPPALLESELFGHARGAFTGAVRDKKGLFEVASGGTLLLDEVGDMPPEMQAKLLRVLQEGTFRRVGGQRERRVDVRVISATLHDLRSMASEKRFREDLLYRLNVVVLAVPPLRLRSEDIPDLVQHLLGRLDAAELGGSPPEVSPSALAALIRHSWPGNVRELQNELLRAAALSDGRVTRELLSPNLQRGAAPTVGSESLGAAVATAEKAAILRALEHVDGSVTRAARLLGISRVVLHRKLNKHGIRRGSSRHFAA